MIRRFLLLLATLSLLVPGLGWAQTNTNTLPPLCTFATLSAGCVPQRVGVVARISDGNSATECATGGTTEVACIYDGAAWQVTPSAGIWVGAISIASLWGFEPIPRSPASGKICSGPKPQRPDLVRSITPSSWARTTTCRPGCPSSCSSSTSR